MVVEEALDPGAPLVVDACESAVDDHLLEYEIAGADRVREHVRVGEHRRRAGETRDRIAIPGRHVLVVRRGRNALAAGGQQARAGARLLRAGGPRFIDELRRAVLEVAARTHAVGRAEGGRVLAQDRFDLRRRPDEIAALFALAVRVLAGEEGTARSRHLAAEVSDRLGDRPDEIAGSVASPRHLGVEREELPLVVEHLLEVGDRPIRVGAVAMEASAELVEEPAARHLVPGRREKSRRGRRLGGGQEIEGRR